MFLGNTIIRHLHNLICSVIKNYGWFTYLAQTVLKLEKGDVSRLMSRQQLKDDVWVVGAEKKVICL